MKVNGFGITSILSFLEEVSRIEHLVFEFNQRNVELLLLNLLVNLIIPDDQQTKQGLSFHSQTNKSVRPYSEAFSIYLDPHCRIYLYMEFGF